ncbi:molybdopterin converting factor subunit 1 [Microvirga tunisiensis]|uniref:Molybdopterin converting factor subunit 1 n=2 Tax=Pannonibacter tanglangensis TaxID=2750084 RepID=A0ABW9ZEL8_9HYPH|nr:MULTISPECIES: molybdopterin converting factor subunit 1 [unclassified Pannonibacter]NBN63282.1 molybdopterin converting factor subunit 1 [Pannonibacter sp. XCT-34]NBN76921.1 molybdopterin converting factor subunit 1 [Pannonibacter sp. XCT-53]
MLIRYFAWVRERVGLDREEVELPPTVVTVADVITWLQTVDDAHGHAFEDPEVIRAALDQVHVEPDTPIGAAREIAFFPPMTGG